MEWLIANVFLIGMPAAGAGIFFGGVKLLELAGIGRDSRALGILAIVSVAAVFILFRSLIQRLERR